MRGIGAVGRFVRAGAMLASGNLSRWTEERLSSDHGLTSEVDGQMA
ncbi:MAG TPA: hypothetical protein VHX40_03100 [Acidimicrobiales bacterium]|nr:hypothetical protein [Acidimicrobiales bacterium]